ncbi:unnamed protein product [Acanthosepion pharaonis]|uniref:Uncharacterized protein n=1 Tax=Acanthosepion pharaonis TaxID=158019 RepID=A0A812DM51_ACAPH|nr:unnamed protein product [Sepia pharaonis]
MMKKTTRVKPPGLRYELKFLSGKFENHQFRPVTESSTSLRLVYVVGSWSGEDVRRTKKFTTVFPSSLTSFVAVPLSFPVRFLAFFFLFSYSIIPVFSPLSLLHLIYHLLSLFIILSLYNSLSLMSSCSLFLNLIFPLLSILLFHSLYLNLASLSFIHSFICCFLFSLSLSLSLSLSTHPLIIFALFNIRCFSSVLYFLNSNLLFFAVCYFLSLFLFYSRRLILVFSSL